MNTYMGYNLGLGKGQPDLGLAENFMNSFVQGLWYDPQVMMNELFGKHEKAKEIQARAQQKYPTEGGFSGLAGSALGMGVPTVAAVAAGTLGAAPAAIVGTGSILYYSLLGAGQGRQEVKEWEESHGVDISPETEAAVAVGFGALAGITERLGLGKLVGISEKAIPKALESITRAGMAGKSTLRTGVVEAAKMYPKMGLVEGLEEAVEQVGQNVIGKAAWNKPGSIMEDVPTSFLGGMIGALPIPGTAVGTARLRWGNVSVMPASTQESIEGSPAYMDREALETAWAGMKPAEDMQGTLGNLLILSNRAYHAGDVSIESVSKAYNDLIQGFEDGLLDTNFRTEGEKEAYADLMYKGAALQTLVNLNKRSKEGVEAGPETTKLGGYDYDRYQRLVEQEINLSKEFVYRTTRTGMDLEGHSAKLGAMVINRNTGEYEQLPVNASGQELYIASDNFDTIREGLENTDYDIQPGVILTDEHGESTFVPSQALHFEMTMSTGEKMAPASAEAYFSKTMVEDLKSISKAYMPLVANPVLSGYILDKLRKDFPYISELEPRSALSRSTVMGESIGASVVWARQGTMETVPHEYFHAYANIFRRHPLIIEALKKYGDIETLTKRIGVYYALRAQAEIEGKKTSFHADEFSNISAEENHWLTRWLRRFWAHVRRVFTSESANTAFNEVAEAFYEGRPLASGQSIAEYIAKYHDIYRDYLSGLAQPDVDIADEARAKYRQEILAGNIDNASRIAAGLAPLHGSHYDQDIVRDPVSYAQQATLNEREVEYSLSGELPPSLSEQAKLYRKVRDHLLDTHPMSNILKSLQKDVIVEDFGEVKDINPFNEYILSPEVALKGFPEHQRVAALLIEAELVSKYKTMEHRAMMDAARKGLSPREEKLVRKGLRDMARGRSAEEAFYRLYPKAYEAAHMIRRFLNMMRKRIQKYKREMYRAHVPKDDYAAFERILNGEHPDDVVPKSEERRMRIIDLVEEYEKIDKWGIDDYIPNTERGIYRIMEAVPREDGNLDFVTRAIGVTRYDAEMKAKKLATEEGLSRLYIDNEIKYAAHGERYATSRNFAMTMDRIRKAKDLDTQSFIEELSKILGGKVKVLPTLKFAGPMVQRQEEGLKGEENIFDALMTYAYVVEKKINVDPALLEVRKVIQNSPSVPNANKLLLSQADYAKGKYSFGDRIVDDYLMKRGLAPGLYTEAIARARNVSAVLKLGYRPVASMINLAGGIGHTWTKVGTKYLTEAIRAIQTEDGKQLIDEESPYLGIEFSLGTGETDIFMKKFYSEEEDEVKLRKLKWWTPLGLFQAPEPFVRKVCFMANYLKAKADGKTDIAAREFARRSVRFQQFVYNMAALPRMLRSPAGRLFGQFKTYLVKELEFIGTLSGLEWLRYGAMTMLLGGPRGMLYMIRSIPLIAAFAGIDKLEEWLNAYAPRAIRGLMGFAGGDITAPAVVQLPNKPEDWLGPIMGEGLSLMTRVVVPAIRGDKYVVDDLEDFVTNLAPIAYYWNQLWQHYANEDGYIRNSRGEILYKLSEDWDRQMIEVAMLASGITPIEKSKIDLQERIYKRERERRLRNTGKIYDHMVEAIQRGEGIDQDDIYSLLMIGGDLTRLPQTLRSHLGRAQMLPGVRRLVEAPRSQKGRVMELMLR